jgi:hypothetical protein
MRHSALGHLNLICAFKRSVLLSIAISEGLTRFYQLYEHNKKSR